MKNDSETRSDVGKQDLIKRGMNVVAGLDIGDKQSYLCLIDLDGQIVEREEIRTSQPVLEKYFSA